MNEDDDTICEDCLYRFPYALNSQCCPICHSKIIMVIYFKSGEPKSVIKKRDLEKP